MKALRIMAYYLYVKQHSQNPVFILNSKSSDNCKSFYLDKHGVFAFGPCVNLSVFLNQLFSSAVILITSFSCQRNKVVSKILLSGRPSRSQLYLPCLQQHHGICCESKLCIIREEYSGSLSFNITSASKPVKGTFSRGISS